MPRAGLLDFYFRRYKWDYWTYMAQPEWLIDELEEGIFPAEYEFENTKKDSTGSFAGRYAKPSNMSMPQALQALEFDMPSASPN